MSIIRRNGSHQPVEVLINPVEFRRIIFCAVKNTHPVECQEKYVHFDPRKVIGRNRQESSRSFVAQFGHLDVRLTVNKHGKRYILGGSILNTRSGDVFKIEAFVKSVPRRYLINRETAWRYLSPSISQFNERIDHLSNEMACIRQDHNSLMSNVASPRNTIPDPTYYEPYTPQTYHEWT